MGRSVPSKKLHNRYLCIYIQRAENMIGLDLEAGTFYQWSTTPLFDQHGAKPQLIESSSLA